MRIACVAPDDLSTIIFCKTLSRLLEERGHQLVTIGAVGEFATELADEVRSEHVDLGPYRYLAPAADLRYLTSLYRAFRRHRADVVLTFTTKPNVAGAIAARLAGVRTVGIAVRGLGQAFNESPGSVAHLVRWTLYELYRVAFRLGTLAWFTNVSDRDFFITSGACRPSKVLLTRNAVDVTAYRPESTPEHVLDRLREELGLHPGDRSVVMVARLIWQKGIREFVEAAQLLRDRLPAAQFLLVAPPEPGSPNAVPLSYIHDAETLGNFRWLGFRKDVVDLYSLADLAVLPSYYKEGGYPRALLEPMALGKPVLAADTPDCRGPVHPGRNGLLVPPRDPGALADAIEWILVDPTRMARFGVESRRIIESDFDDRLVFAQVLDRLGVR